MDKRFRPPSLQALQSLVQVADSSSFTEAARLLCLTQSAISRQIQQLEAHYQVALFERSSRKVELTAQGRALCTLARELLHELQALEERLAPPPLGRPFRIQVFVSLAVRWLLPRLSAFYAANPGLCLSIETVSGEQVETGGDCDAYVLYLREELDQRPLTRLFDEYLLPVCAPHLSGGQPLPRSLDELAGHALIHGSTGRNEWTQWLHSHHRSGEQDYQHLMFNLDDLALDAAARGLGVAMTDRMLAHDALARGDLVVPFGEPLRTGAFYAFWLPDKGAPHPAAAAVLAWFQEQLEHTHAAQQR